MEDPNRPRMGSHAGPAAQGEKGEKSKRKKRQKNVKVKFKGESEAFQVERNQEGKFECPVCSISYDDPSGIQKHVAKHQKSDLPFNNRGTSSNAGQSSKSQKQPAPPPGIRQPGPAAGPSMPRTLLTQAQTSSTFNRTAHHVVPRVSQTQRPAVSTSAPTLKNRITASNAIPAQRPVPSTSSNQTGVIRASNPFSLPTTSRAARTSNLPRASATLRGPDTSPSPSTSRAGQRPKAPPSISSSNIPRPTLSAPEAAPPSIASSSLGMIPTPAIRSGDYVFPPYVKEEPREPVILKYSETNFIDLTLDDTPEPETRPPAMDIDDDPGLPEFDPLTYTEILDEHTIVDHPIHNLAAMSLIINTLLKSALCTECKEGTEPHDILKHALRHNPFLKIPETISDELTEEYGLVALKDIPYPDHPIPPIYGLPILPELLYFCAACHRGYFTADSLRGHQGNLARCNVRTDKRASYRRYGQCLTKGREKRYFPVDVTGLAERHVDVSNYVLVFEQTVPPPTDYSKEPIRNVEDQLNLGPFLYREGWQELVEGHTPADIVEATRLPYEEEPWGIAIQMAAKRSMEQVQPLINANQSFGLAQVIAQFFPIVESNPRHSLTRLTSNSQETYGNKVARLLFNVIRNMTEEWASSVNYPPLDPSQIEILQELRNAADGENEDEIDDAFHAACYTLYAHERHQYETSSSLNRFFSPVNAFVVYASLKEDGSFRLASEMTSTLAVFEYSIRSVMLVEVEYSARVDKANIFHILEQVKRYLQTNHETPMAFIYNAHRLLKSIRSDEVKDPQFRMTDPYGREVSYLGHLVRLDAIKQMHDDELVRYREFIRKHLFFDEEIPTGIFPKYEIEDLVDNINNNAVGYSFIDDPQNGFEAYRRSYGVWLLSDPVRFKKFADCINGKIRWKMEEVFKLLQRLEESRQILAPGAAHSTVIQVRGSEF